jgi:hypothetical protein
MKLGSNGGTSDLYTWAGLLPATLEDHSRCVVVVHISIDCGSYEMRFIVWNVPARFNTLGKVQPDWWKDGLVKISALSA